MISKNIPNLKDYRVIDHATVKTEKKDNKDVDRDDREGISTMDAIDWMAEGDSFNGHAVTLIAYNIYFMPKNIGSGSCNIDREHKEIVTVAKENEAMDVITIKSLKTKDQNCGIVCFTNMLKRKDLPNKVREKLNIPLNTPISIDQLDKLVDYFNCDIKLYIKTTSEGIKLIKQTNRYDKVIEMYLNDNHYFIITKHSLTKDYGFCEKCKKQKNNSVHKCDYNDLQILKAEQLLKLTEKTSWDTHYINIVDAIKKGFNIILSGAGGFGKSYMISKLSEMFKLCKTSSTGISAVNIEGCTIHSMLRGIMFDKDDEWKNADYDALVIDEISMLSGVLFDQIYTGIKKINEKREKPICLIVCGDVMQLPPVNSTSGYFFNAHHFEDFEMNAYTAKLSECKRQDNKEFIDVLQRVRITSCTDNDIRYIQNMKHNKIDENDAVYMSSTNEVVNKINKRYFDANKNEKFDIKKQIHLSVKHSENDKAAQITFNKDDFDDKTKAKISDFIDDVSDISVKKIY